MTLNDAVNRAVNWHPSIREAVGKLLVQNEQIEVARSKYYPQVSAGVNNGYSNTYTDHGYSPSLVLSVSQMLYDFGKVASQVRAETAGAAQQQANVLLSIDTVAHETANAIVQTQSWQQMVEAAEEQLVALDGIGKLIRQRSDEGATSISDVVQTEARIESARSQLAQYQANLDSAKASLMSWLGWNSLNGINNDFPAKLARSCETATPDDRLVPAVLAAWAQANVARANLEYANAQMTPTISLEPSVQHYLNDKYPSHEVLDKTQYSTWVKVEMPLYQGGGLTARRNAASHAVDAAQSTIQRTRLDVRQKLMEARSQAMSLASALQILRRQQQLSERTRELEQIREMITSSTLATIVDLPFFFLFMIVLAIIAPPLAWIAPVAALLMILPGVVLQKKLAVLANQAAHEATLRNAVLVESVQGLEDIKLMQAENRFLQQWNSYIRITGESGLRTRKLTQGLISWGMSVQSLVYAAVIMFGAPMVIEGSMTTGAVVAASMLGSRMIAPMANLCGVLARWQQVKAAKMGLDNIMQLPTETQHDDSLIHRDILHGHYLFENAQFRYHNDDQRIPLRLVRLEIMPGERIAILGRNGAGKSTLLQAMAGSLEMIQGEARLDNLSLSHIDMADLRRNIGFLSQNARLFFGTLRENLTLGAPHASDEQIFDALEVSGGAVFVRRLAKGLDHPIMEGGNGLSGGQRQSLLLARMLLRSPNIVLLDEPSASLDEHTEREFIQRLHQWLGNRTLVVATHRVPLLELVERVVVLKEGQLVMDAPKAQALNADRMQSHRREWKNENQSA
ncbi:TolC family outer membrane protein [Salmonella enterica]|nr:TolC family outer membrane protein [Salmonella enterica]ELP0327466.1 TolC family outer membrane protein [Salmonella enterica]